MYSFALVTRRSVNSRGSWGGLRHGLRHVDLLLLGHLLVRTGLLTVHRLLLVWHGLTLCGIASCVASGIWLNDHDVMVVVTCVEVVQELGLALATLSGTNHRHDAHAEEQARKGPPEPSEAIVIAIVVAIVVVGAVAPAAARVALIV